MSASLAENKIVASVNKKNYQANEKIVINFEINSKQAKNLRFPVETASYKAIAKAASTSIEMINGDMTQTKKITYTLLPKVTGNIVIPSASIKINNLIYRSQPIAVSVSTKPAPQSINISKPSVSQSSRKLNQAQRAAQSLFAKVEISNYRPYVNQQVVMKLKIFHRGNLRNINLPEVKLDDFLHERLDKTKEYETTYAGRKYLVYEIDYILYPHHTGRMEIPATEVDVVALMSPQTGSDLFSFGIGFKVDEDITLNTSPVYMQVQALPQPTPENFSGYVGSLSLENYLDNKDILYGEAITLASEIEGVGNPNLIAAKDIIQESDQYELYTDKDILDLDFQNNKQVFYKKIQNAIITETDASRFNLKTREISYFDPTKKQYQTIPAEEFTINIDHSKRAYDEQLSSFLGSKTKKKEASKRALLIIPEAQILGYQASAIHFHQVCFAIFILNLAALIYYLNRKFKNKLLQAGKSNTKGLDYKKTTKKIKSSVSTTEISTEVKTLIQKLKKREKLTPETLELYEKFIEKTNKFNYGVQNTEVDLVSNDLKEEALSLVKALKVKYG
jgi:hypothetical protein